MLSAATTTTKIPAFVTDSKTILFREQELLKPEIKVKKYSLIQLLQNNDLCMLIRAETKIAVLEKIPVSFHGNTCFDHTIR